MSKLQQEIIKLKSEYEARLEAIPRFPTLDEEAEGDVCQEAIKLLDKVLDMMDKT